MTGKKLKNLSAAFIFLLISATLRAEVKLPAIFGNNMVLQQQTDAAIWGEASPGKTVNVMTSWNKRSYTVRSDSHGKWKLKVKTPNAGGPYAITISDGKTLTLKNVLIGEVWFCSGQSNMFMPMKGYRNQPVAGSNKAIATSGNANIHLFTVEKEKSITPLNDFSGQWQECTPENVADFSAAAYYFGKMIQQALDVPVGLISSSWGGTRIEPWMSESGVKKFDFVSLQDGRRDGEITQQTPTVLFNAMVNPVVGYAMKGALWYQGEANRKEPDQYLQLLPGLVQDWREQWGIGDFAFYYAQIAPFDYPTPGLNSAYLREAQLKASDAMPNSGMACLLDIGEKNIIHPSDKEATGDRLAYLALAKTYGEKGFEYSGPVLKEMTVEGSTAKLTFDHAENGLTTFGQELNNFEVAGENKHFYPATAVITRNGVSVSSPMVDKPVAVRYAFEDYVVGTLYNTEGLPASSFRTDDWKE